ncbi:hypothetical protein H920_00730 [Fukomys damarensis]|uniref:Uncharacterized protein n=1 Tax=Fukomys damarensis TaxID=885580 RepID=A0A091E547_FUKDA|nr:hypothetical protein H920_00730 [Fukomys damarensis]
MVAWDGAGPGGGVARKAAPAQREFSCRTLRGRYASGQRGVRALASASWRPAQPRRGQVRPTLVRSTPLVLQERPGRHRALKLCFLYGARGLHP